MKRITHLLVSLVLFLTSSVVFSQEVSLKGEVALKGGPFFKGIAVANDCQDLFAFKSDGKTPIRIPFQNFFETDSEDIIKISGGKVAVPLVIHFSDGSEEPLDFYVYTDEDLGNIEIPVKVVNPSVYSESTIKYRITNNWRSTPDYETNVIPEVSETKDSLIEKVVHMPSVTAQYGSLYTLDLGGFFYVISDKKSTVPSNPQVPSTSTYTSEKWGQFNSTVEYDERIPTLFSELCARHSIPYIKTVDGKLLVPVADGGTTLSWILGRYFGIKIN